MCIGLFCHFLLWIIVLDGHSAVILFWVQKNIRVCALGFLVVFYSEKFFWTSIWLLGDFAFRENSEYVHWAFSSFSFLDNCLGRAFGRYLILGSEKYPSMRIGVFGHFLFRKILLDEHWATTPFWV